MSEGSPEIPVNLEALENLLLSLFSDQELRSHMGYKLDLPAHDLPSTPAAPRLVASEAVKALRSRGLIGPQLWASLTHARPGRAADIAQVQRTTEAGIAAARRAAEEATRRVSDPDTPPPPSPPPASRRPAPPRLYIQHTGLHDGQHRFTISHGQATQMSEAVTIPAPSSVRVCIPEQGGGAVDQPLDDRLRFVLEEVPDYPFAPWSSWVGPVDQGLSRWGRAVCDALLSAPIASGYLHEFLTQVKQAGVPGDVTIVAMDEAVLAWPWEAVSHDTLQQVPWGREHRVSRANSLAQPGREPEAADKLRVLVITPRPLVNDAWYTPLPEAILSRARATSVAIDVVLCRPPTVNGLRHAVEHEGPFQIVHFDGHGVATGGMGRPVLLFERWEGAPTGGSSNVEEIDAIGLMQILRRAPSPVQALVLTACQSAATGGGSGPFTSFATQMLAGEVPTVVAMSHSVTVSGARAFVSEFYDRLFATNNLGDVAYAATCARDSMAVRPTRSLRSVVLSLPDWVVPRVYRKGEPRVGLSPQASAASAASVPTDLLLRGQVVVPHVDDAGATSAPTRGKLRPITGCDRDIRTLDHQTGCAGILFHGPNLDATRALALGYATWLWETSPRRASVARVDLATAKGLADALCARLAGQPAGATDDQELPEGLIHPLCDDPWLIVLDNAHSATDAQVRLLTEVLALLQSNLHGRAIFIADNGALAQQIPPENLYAHEVRKP